MKYLFALLVGAVTIWSFLVPDAPLFQRPELARIFFWHFPCPMLLMSLMFIGGYFCLRYFIRIVINPSNKRKGDLRLLGFTVRLEPETDQAEKRKWDVRAESALELGLVFAVLTMASGMIFSLAQWGALWQWDPRQTSFLIALLIYGAYFALRGATADPETRASHSAAYMLAAILPLLFLIMVFPRLPQIQKISFHPTDTIISGNLTGQYLYVTLAVMTVVFIFSAWLYRLRVRVGMLELEKDYGQLETGRGDTPATAVVRPVRISPKG